MSTSGKYITVFVGATEIAGNHEFTIQETTDRLEATRGRDRGRGRKDGGVTDTKATVKWYLDIADGSFAALRAATIINNVQFYHSVDNPIPLYVFDEAEIFDFQVVGQVRGQMICTCELEAKGDVVSANDPTG